MVDVHYGGRCCMASPKLTEIFSGWGQVKILKEKNGRIHMSIALEDDKLLLRQLSDKPKRKKRVVKK